MHALLCSVPPTLQQATTDPCLHQRLLDTHGQAVSPFNWVLVHQVLFVPFKSLFPRPCVSSGSSMVGLTVISFKTAYAKPRSATPRAPDPSAVLPRPVLCSRYSNSSVSVSVGSLGPGAHKVCLSPLSVSGGCGV